MPFIRIHVPRARAQLKTYTRIREQENTTSLFIIINSLASNWQKRNRKNHVNLIWIEKGKNGTEKLPLKVFCWKACRTTKSILQLKFVVFSLQFALGYANSEGDRAKWNTLKREDKVNWVRKLTFKVTLEHYFLLLSSFLRNQNLYWFSRNFSHIPIEIVERVNAFHLKAFSLFEFQIQTFFFAQKMAISCKSI